MAGTVARSTPSTDWRLWEMKKVLSASAFAEGSVKRFDHAVDLGWLSSWAL